MRTATSSGPASSAPPATTTPTGSRWTPRERYVAGYTSYALPGQTSAGSLDAFVVKLDATDGDDDGGWTRQFGSAGYDYARGIAVDGTGVYVAGYTYGTLTWPDQLGSSTRSS